MNNARRIYERKLWNQIQHLADTSRQIRLDWTLKLSYNFFPAQEMPSHFLFTLLLLLLLLLLMLLLLLLLLCIYFREPQHEVSKILSHAAATPIKTSHAMMYHDLIVFFSKFSLQPFTTFTSGRQRLLDCWKWTDEIYLR